jgi:hypothetical protein
MYRSLYRSPDADPSASGAPVAPATSNPIAAAIAAARTAPPSTPPAEPAPTHHSHTQPRTPAGEFAPVDGPPAAQDAEAPIPVNNGDGQEDPSVAGALEAGDTPPPPPQDAETAPEPIVVAIPGRNPHDPDFQIQVDDQETAERLSQLRNAAMRGDQARAALAKAERIAQEAEEYRQVLEMDPAGFVLAELRDAQAKEQVLLSLLTDGSIMTENLREQISIMLGDETTAARIAAEIKAARYERRDQVRETLTLRREVAANAQAVRQAIALAAPAALPAEQRQVFIQDAQREVAAYARRQNLQLLNPADVPLILQARIRAWGGDPDAVAAAIVARSGRTRGTVEAQPRQSAAPAQRPTGQQLVKASQAKRAGAVVAPAGAGAPPSGPSTPPKGMNVADAAKWYRENVLGR